MIAPAAQTCHGCVASHYQRRWTTRIVLRCPHGRALLDDRRVAIRVCRRCLPTDAHLVAVLLQALPVWRLIDWHSVLLFWSDGEASAPVWRHHLPALSMEPNR